MPGEIGSNSTVSPPLESSSTPLVHGVRVHDFEQKAYVFMLTKSTNCVIKLISQKSCETGAFETVCYSLSLSSSELKMASRLALDVFRSALAFSRSCCVFLSCCCVLLSCFLKL